jgi:hypothetical protein
MTLDMLGIETVELPCHAGTGFVPDPREAEPLIGTKVRAIVLVTPNNPTGAIYPPETIRAFAELSARRGIALLVDETYRDFLPPGSAGPHDLFSGFDWRKTVVGLYSFSKAYCIPGQRMGAITASQEVLAEIAKIVDCVQICPTRAPQRGLVWGIEALASWREKNRAIILDRAAAFRRAIAGLDGWSVDSIGAYFAYLRHPFPGKGAVEVASWLAAERGVLALPGPYFGSGQESHLRVAFANVDVAAIASLPARLETGVKFRPASGGRTK